MKDTRNIREAVGVAEAGQGAGVRPSRSLPSRPRGTAAGSGETSLVLSLVIPCSKGRANHGAVKAAATNADCKEWPILVGFVPGACEGWSFAEVCTAMAEKFLEATGR